MVFHTFTPENTLQPESTHSPQRQCQDSPKNKMTAIPVFHVSLKDCVFETSRQKPAKVGGVAHCTHGGSGFHDRLIYIKHSKTKCQLNVRCQSS